MKTDAQGDPEIVGWLTTSRSILLQNRSVPHMEEGLRTALRLVDEVEIEGARRVLEFCLKRALDEVASGRFQSAGWILNLVHNLPVSTASRNWDIDFFFKAWLPSFLEHYDEVAGAREIVLRVCGEVAASEELREGKWHR